MLVLNCMRHSLGLYASLVVVTITNIAFGAQFEEAKVTAVVHDVKLLRGEAVLRAATVNDEIRADTAVRTGLESRSELTFPDLTLARLGANTIFRFNQKAREVNLINGAILLRVPKNSGGATITTDAVTAGIVGTTVMMEYHPRGIAKFIVLEGVARLYLKKRVGESILVHAGEMMIIRWGATELSNPVAVDISEIMRTSLLITGFGPLPSAPLIATTETDQIQRESQGQLVETNLVIYGSGTLVTVNDETDQRFAAAPPANSKFGKPETIRNPNPFPITNATQINTDPTITTGKVTASGKIYRGPADDGPMSQYLFGSTSAFDTALRFDQFFKDLANLPVAVFKFQNLALLGNPTITVGQNGVTKLGLIGVDGITSGAPGGSLTFNGLDLLFLATKAGSINLTGNLSFQNLSTLGIYARGLGSNLTLASPISGVTNLILAAENAVQISGQLAATGANVLSDVSVNAGSDLSSSALLAFTVQNGGRIINTGGNIHLTAGGDISSQDLRLLIANNNGGNIRTGGNISVTTGGNLTANSIDALVNNRSGGMIDSGSDITFNVNGALITQNDAGFTITSGLTAAASRIGSDVSLEINAGSVNIGGNLISDLLAQSPNGSFVGISNAGTTIAGSAAYTWNVAGDMIIQGNARMGIENHVDTATLPAGTIQGNATLQVSAANLAANLIDAFIDNSSGGRIGGNARLDFAVTGNAAVTTDALFRILGSDGAASAAININGGNYSAGGTFLGLIDGNGIFTLNRATIAADVVRVGVLGNNGTLRIGGGSISANSLLHLYAPGSNGTVDFVSNVTLSTSNAIPAIVANTVTIENGVVVTVDANADGAREADVFTNNPNYTGSGGNGSTTGTFAGNGAATQPFGQAPPFLTKRGSSNAVTLGATVVQTAEAGSSPALGSGHPRSGPRARYRSSANHATFRVIDTSQLQSVLDNAARGSNGKLHISSTKTDRKASVRTAAGTVPRRKNIARSVDAKALSPVLALNAR